MLIDQNGEKQGIVSIDDALNAARAAKLDLVQVSSSNTNPVVCKLLDYGKHIFSKKKNKLIYASDFYDDCYNYLRSDSPYKDPLLRL